MENMHGVSRELSSETFLMMWHCWIGWHNWTAWSLPFELELQATTYGGINVGAPYFKAFQNRRCRACGFQQQRSCGYPTGDPKSQQFVSLGIRR